ncbi:MAG: carbohydrate ABC transporter substrate-binding protein [Roseburia sp.]|nr:carbohydrate ABC transporter substrate-binding protein [Roseburia sp.]
MKFKKMMAVTLIAAMTMSMAACGNNEAGTTNGGNAGTTDDGNAEAAGTESADAGSTATGALSYADITLGEDYTDLTATISMFNHRTDMDSEDYGGKNWASYIADFNQMYPNITVNITTTTSYADDALMHLQAGDYETIMCIPAVDKSDLDSYFISYGDLDTMKSEINYASTWEYGGEVYGVPSTATTQGIVYNKKVFEEAGVTEIPKTPDEFIAALQAIKDNTDAIPLYTNYAAGWTMGAWDAYIGNNATGDSTYMNQKLVHTANPFKDYGDETHAYAVYKVLYDAVANGLIEDDYATTDWEGCKGMINNGEIGCMVLGSWAIPQMKAAGDNADDIGYMPFPISIDGVQYASDGADYSYGINANATEDEQAAAMVFVKWLTEESGFSYNEDGLPVDADSTETKLSFDGVTFIQDEPSVAGEEDLLNEMNSESELNINAGGDTKIQQIIEHAANGDMTFDEIMDQWNQSWSDAQESLGVEVTEE